MTAYTRYVNTASTAGGDGTTNATTGATRAYASLSEAEADTDAGITPSSGDTYEVLCCGTAADTSAVYWNGWSSNWDEVALVGNRAESDGFNDDPNSLWSTSHYRLQVNAARAYYNSYAGPLVRRIDGLQINCEQSNSAYEAIFTAYGINVIRNNRFTKGFGVSGNILVSGAPSQHYVQAEIYNNIIFGSNHAGLVIGASGASTREFDVYNNTIFDVDRGIAFNGNSSSVTHNLYNNVIFNCPTYHIEPTSNEPLNVVNHDYNVVDGTTVFESESNGVTMGTGVLTADMVDPENATLEDGDVFPVASGDLDGTGTTNGGAAPTTDLVGVTRAATPCAGALELVVAGGSIALNAASFAFTAQDPALTTMIALLPGSFGITPQTASLKNIITLAAASYLFSSNDITARAAVRLAEASFNLSPVDLTIGASPLEMNVASFGITANTLSQKTHLELVEAQINWSNGSLTLDNLITLTAAAIYFSPKPFTASWETAVAEATKRVRGIVRLIGR